MIALDIILKRYHIIAAVAHLTTIMLNIKMNLETKVYKLIFLKFKFVRRKTYFLLIQSI